MTLKLFIVRSSGTDALLMKTLPFVAGGKAAAAAACSSTPSPAFLFEFNYPP